MGDTDEGTRLVAVCTDCGAAFAARVLQDGGIKPIGTKGGCSECGGTEFEPRSETDLPGDDGAGDIGADGPEAAED
ncbi:hypothetical protein [Halomicrobium salinisoli]|uniref:hypothetical protein n=1 Tax=Halomicrobium salinisoli TaxID=2878391 RepID=UPI001CEFBACA|nr:hypothetical protein [Halomicrobium salinisoli]